jgi:predicted O-methyltransferase YrrM
MASLVRKLRVVRELEAEVRRLRAEYERLQQTLTPWQGLAPPGSFDSPLPGSVEVSEALQRMGRPTTFPGIDLNEAEQVALLDTLAAMYPEQPFPTEPSPGFRYHLHNGSYGAFDGIMLYGMLRWLQPRRIVEVGSGFSSAAMLDVNERVLSRPAELTFIDPDMSRLRALLRETDRARVTLLEQRVQDVPLDVFAALDDRDVLFIDSSHVSKIGSDVNHLLFAVLPALRRGVRVHVHDIMGDFEYPRVWFMEGRAWNEQYLLRAFLMYNPVFRIELWTGWLFNTRHDTFRERLPLCVQGGGGQIWLRKDG